MLGVITKVDILRHPYIIVYWYGWKILWKCFVAHNKTLFQILSENNAWPK
jgi:hypothetical protein